jgi:hypothetical protein
MGSDCLCGTSAGGRLSTSENNGQMVGWQMTGKNWNIVRPSPPQIPDGCPLYRNPILRCMKPVTDWLKFDIANSLIHIAALCVVTLRFALLWYRRFGDTYLFYLEGRKWLGCGYCRVKGNVFSLIILRNILYFSAYKTHRPIRRTMIFSLEILEKKMMIVF